MGKLDTETKRYVSKPSIFADAFNYLLFNGEQIIKPDALSAVDTTEIITPYGNNAKIPIQRYRDTMKIWAAMQDQNAVYVLLGGELQSDIHYAMPVRDMLYDSINYAAQVSAARTSYGKKKDIRLDENGVKIDISNAEFLSGFRKGDKLIPVITAVLYFGSEEWDAPMSIHEMLKVADERYLAFIPDYRINLIAPARIPDADFEDKFHTGFGTLMHVIKHKNDSVSDIFTQVLMRSRNLDDDTVDLIEEVANVKFERVYDEKGDVIMCKAMEAYTLKTRIETLIDYLREEGVAEEQIAERVAKKFDVTVEYVKELMLPKAV